MARAVIFDMDGVIVDSERYWRDQIEDILEAAGDDVDAHTPLPSGATTERVSGRDATPRPGRHGFLGSPDGASALR